MPTKLQNFRVKKNKSTIFLSNEKNLFKKKSEPPNDSDKTFILSRKFRGINLQLFCNFPAFLYW